MIDQEALKSVEDLHRLKTEGVITEQDYKKAKERLLFGPKPAAPSPIASVLRAGSGPVERPAEEDQLGWVLLPLRRYADFTGRSSRKEFWMFQGVVALFGIVAFAVIGGDDGGTLSALVLGPLVLAAFGLLVPQLALQVRRLHDQDRSGLFVLLNLVPYVGPLVVLAFMLVEGTRGDNQFGADPVAR